MAKYRRYKKRVTPIPKNILKEFNLLSVSELLAKEEELKQELKELKSKIYDKNSKDNLLHEKYWNTHDELINKIKDKLEEDFLPHKNSALGNFFGFNNKIESERTVVKSRLSYRILDRLTKKNNSFYKSIDYYGVSQMRSHFKRHKLDISFTRTNEDTPGNHPAYDITGNYAKKIFSDDFCLTKKELEEFIELEKKFSDKENRTHEYKNRIGIIENLLSKYPSLIKTSKQRKKNTRLAMYDQESREIGSDIVRHIRKTTPDPYLCPYCNKTTDHKNSHVDHINPISNGGLSVKNNMVLVCSKCNLKKRDYPLWVFCKRNKYKYEEIAERLFKLGKWV